MNITDRKFLDFLFRAKRGTYAAHGAESTPSRPNSHDLYYRENDLLYIDTYLGGYDFAGQEGVWETDQPLWAMNYYGRLLVSDFPEGLPDFLKAALREISGQAPFRGPRFHQLGEYKYHCSWQGELGFFSGNETIEYQDNRVYELLFHGGRIR
jgi:hypothetical protein